MLPAIPPTRTPNPAGCNPTESNRARAIQRILTRRSDRIGSVVGPDRGETAEEGSDWGTNSSGLGSANRVLELSLSLSIEEGKWRKWETADGATADGGRTFPKVDKIGSEMKDHRAEIL